MYRRSLLAAGLFAALALAAAAPAQVAKTKEPKANPAPKPIPKNVSEAERKLLEFNCALHRANEKREDTKLRGNRLNPFAPFNPFVPPGPVDHVAFPPTTKDADLVRLVPYAARLAALKSIDLGGCENITEKGLKELKKLKNLEALFLDGTPVTAAWLKELAGLRTLKWLDLSNTPVSDAAVTELNTAPLLNTLILHHPRDFTAEGVKHLVAMGQLRFLDITVEKDPDGMCRQLATSKWLSALKVSPVGDSEAVHLGKMEHLDTLDLSNDFGAFGRMDKPKIPVVARKRAANDLSDAGLNRLVGCKTLRALDVTGNADITGAGIDEFTRMPRLEELTLRGTSFRDAGLARLSAMTNLRLIDLRSTGVTDAGMGDLADLPAVQRLYLGMNAIGDPGLRELTRLRSLQVLDLSGTKVRCAGVRDLKNFSQLEHLHLANTNVTTSSFPSLAALKSLRFLNLLDNCPDVTYNSVQPLREEMPGCLVLASHPMPQFAGGWPGAENFPFRLPDIKYVRPPNVPSTTVKIASTVKVPPPPPAPPPIRPVVGGAGTGPRP